MEEINERGRIGPSRNLARDLIKKSKIREAPVSLRVIITYLQSTHNLDVYPAVNFSDTLSGILITVEDETKTRRRDEIHYNENHTWHRKRFSIAHEIGHLLFNTSCDEFDGSLYNTKSPNETEANQFASELLMPLSFLNRDLKEGNIDIKDLAWKYIVSEEAMGWKIASSKLLSKI